MEDTLLGLLIPSSNVTILALMLTTFFLSGVVKGFLGIGLPAVAMGLLTLVVTPSHAISLLVLPIFIYQSFAILSFSKSTTGSQALLAFRNHNRDQYFRDIFVFRTISNGFANDCNWSCDGCFCA